ncbi:MAG: 5-oxoprolinase subunit PxpA [Bacteroidia bacterium]|nr:5-oxoprolinase subunit PxpA [Bacteroidia bacterium]
MDQKLRIDLNCDVGEGQGNEAQLFPFISSCNIACGGHAGDAASIREILRLAEQHQVKVGAHPSYPDRKNFGRISLDIKDEALKASIKNQLSEFFTIAHEENIQVHHIKPHGALYNDIAGNEQLAELFLTAAADYLPGCQLYAPFGSCIAELALNSGVAVCFEAFADRNYNENLSLVSRKLANALITDPQTMTDHVLRMVKEKQVLTLEGSLVPIQAQTFCVHGDTPDAVSLLEKLHTFLENEQIMIGL